MPWTCPECKRVFSRNKQAHSCESYDLDPLFAKSKQGIRDLYELLVSKIDEFGTMDSRVSAYGVTFRNLTTFMSIFPERDHLTITFVRDEELNEFPVYQSYHHTKKRWSNLIKVESSDEIDEQLIKWLKEAYEITG